MYIYIIHMFNGTKFEYRIRNLGFKHVLNIRKQLLSYKESLLSKNPYAFRGVAPARAAYCDCLIQQLGGFSPFQFYAILGLLLSDASLRASTGNKVAFRLKMQQTIRHLPFMLHIVRELLPEWIVATTPQRVSSSRNDMLEFQTLTHPAFSIFATILDSAAIVESGKSVNADIRAPFVLTGGVTLYYWLHPIKIAYWFCGDGGRLDYRAVDPSKGILLHTQGFSESSVNHLVQALNLRYGWGAYKKNERGVNQWYIVIPARSYDNFIEIVGPFIHPSLAHKLPSPRKDGSKFGKLNSSLFHSTVSAFFRNEGRYVI